MTSSTDLHKVTREHDALLRTSDIHRSHLKAVSLNADNSAVYGVCGPSPLLRLTGSDVTNHLFPYAVHDLLEGVIGVVLKCVLRGLMSGHILSPDDLERIVSYPYGRNDMKNRSVRLDKTFLSQSGKLKGTASQKLCLFRLLPQVIAGLVPQDNLDWAVYLELR